MVVFKMRESVPIARYPPVCNVLRQWKTSLILTYRVYRLYDIPHTYQPTKPSSRDSVTQKSGINVRLVGQWDTTLERGTVPPKVGRLAGMNM